MKVLSSLKSELVTKVVQVNLQAVTVNLAHLNQNRNIQ